MPARSIGLPPDGIRNLRLRTIFGSPQKPWCFPWADDLEQHQPHDGEEDGSEGKQNDHQLQQEKQSVLEHLHVHAPKLVTDEDCLATAPKCERERLLQTTVNSS